MRPRPTLPLWARVCDLLVCALLALWLAVVVFGGFRVRVDGLRLVSITSPWRILLWTALVAAVRHVLVREPSLPRRIQGALWGRQALSVWLRRAPYLVAVGFLLNAVARYYHPDTGFTQLIGFGSHFADQALPAVKAAPHHIYDDSWGYDGQFYAQLATEPLLRNPELATAIDAPAFRSRRMLFSWSAYLLGFGRPAWILQVYAVQNVVCWLVLAWIMVRWFPPGPARNFCAWFGVLFASGSTGSVRDSLTDLPSLLLIALAIIALDRNRPWFASAILGLSGLARETNILAGSMLTPPFPWQRSSLGRAAAFGGIVVAPLFLWTLYVYFVFHRYDGGIGAFSPPFVSYVAKWRQTIAEIGVNGWTSPARYSLHALVSLTVASAYLAWRISWRDPWWRVGAAYAALLAVLGPAVWGGSPGAVTRVELPVFFAFNVLLVRDRWFWLWFVPGNLTVLHGLAVIDLIAPTAYF
jgi:hypothetical protein